MRQGFAKKPETQDGMKRPDTICPDCPDFVLKSRDSANPIDTPCPDCPDLSRLFLTCTGCKTGKKLCVMGRAENLIRAIFSEANCRIIAA